VRVSGYEFHDGGYIDQSGTGAKRRFNQSDVYGGRIDALFTPTDALSIGSMRSRRTSRVMAWRPRLHAVGPAARQQLGAAAPDRGTVRPAHTSGRGTLTYDFGPAALTSVSGYQTQKLSSWAICSPRYVPLLRARWGRYYGAVGLARMHRPTNLRRKCVWRGRRIRAGMGGWRFYTRKPSYRSQTFILRTPAGLAAPNDVYNFAIADQYEEYGHSAT